MSDSQDPQHTLAEIDSKLAGIYFVRPAVFVGSRSEDGFIEGQILEGQNSNKCLNCFTSSDHDSKI